MVVVIAVMVVVVDVHSTHSFFIQSFYCLFLFACLVLSCPVSLLPLPGLPITQWIESEMYLFIIISERGTKEGKIEGTR